jgi:ATP-dependent DNA helicase RecG
MTPAFDKLSHILSLEREQDFKNQVVIGGLGKMAAAWRQEASQEVQGPDSLRLVDDIAELMVRYSMADGPEPRAEYAARMKEIIESTQAAPLRQPAPLSPPVVQAPSPVVSKPGPTSTPRRQENLAGLKAPVTAMPGISSGYAKKLQRLGVETVEDLIYLFPRRYDDFSQLKTIDKLIPGEEITIIGTLWSVKERKTARGLNLISAIVSDGTGTIEITWFNQPYLLQRLRPNRNIVLSGKVDLYLGRLVMQSPEWEPIEKDLIHTGRLVPVYPLTAGIGARWMRRLMNRTVEYWGRRLPDYLPLDIRERAKLLPLGQAMIQMHFPDNKDLAEKAKHRLAFDEFFLIQLGVLRQRRHWRSEPGRALTVDTALLDDFRNTLPFQFTNAQERTLNEILADIQSDQPMSRLLQGDVGSGKTVVATAAMLMAVASGCQAAIMAPTEILAEQHHKTISRLLVGLSSWPVRVGLLTGSTPKAEREAVYAAIASGEVNIVVGTHALIQSNVAFASLGLVVVDEQHRFGVAQRGALRQKGFNPHMLVMSATPIPRTLSLTVYGDLDVSTINELPPGRQAIKTTWLDPRERERAYTFVRRQIEKGRQSFIICPLVEGSDKIEAKAAVEEYERLSKSIYPDLKLGLVHGRMKAADKEAVMTAFYRGDLSILVATSVVEVGIDVPNASVMLVEGANRFGLAQLHQFRGRVGRGEYESYCLLLSDSDTENSRERLQAIEATQDGFVLAEKDLEMRGPGEFFGTRQSGLPLLKLAELGDVATLSQAREAAQALCEKDCELALPENHLLGQKLRAFWNWSSDLS